MKNLATSETSLNLNTKLAAYATLAGATLAAPAFAPSADAGIIWSGPVSITVPSTTQGVYLNVVTGANITTASSGLTTWDVNPWSATSLSTFSPTGGGYVGQTAAPAGWYNLTAGTNISAASLFGTATAFSSGSPNPLQLNGSGNLIGFRFLNEVTGQTDFGWMRISLGATSGAQPRAIVEYAYENTGASILAGQVPEPTTLALLSVMAVGAVGVRAWRKRKAA